MALQTFLAQGECAHVFLDVGTNLGVQIRKLAEPDKYRGAPILRTFRDLFGPPPWCHVCTVGFEPNPRHERRLDVLEERLRAARAPPLFLFRAAASDADGTAPFLKVGHEGDASKHLRTQRLWLAGSLTYNDSAASTRVPTVDLARVVRAADAALRPRGDGGKILMKLDVEGSEDRVLLHLVRTRALCLVDLIAVEWHRPAPHWFRDDAATRLLSNVTVGVRALLQRLLPRRGCRTLLTPADDETFYKDGRPWPSSAVCES